MAGAHLRGGRRGRLRTFALVILGALVVGLCLGGGITLLLLDDDADATVDSGAGRSPTGSQGDGGSASAVADPTAAADEPAEPEPGPITIAFAGDIYVERTLASRLVDQPDDFVGPFADLVRGADLAIGNLEAALAAGGEPTDKEFVFRAPPAVLDALAVGGFDVLGVANNHALDLGPTGLAETLALKASRTDVALVGVGEDEDAAFAPHVVDVGGQTIAVIAATQVLDPESDDWPATGERPGVASVADDFDRLVQEVESIRSTADTVVVFVHWGNETETCPSSEQQDLAEALTDAGADLIVGANTHTIQSGGRLGDSFVGYGLGNFLFGGVNDETEKSGVLLVEVDGRDVLGYEWRPGRITERVPVPLEGDDAAAAVDEWNERRTCTNLSA